MTKRLFVHFILIISAAYSILAEGILYQTPRVESFHPLYEETRLTSPLHEEHPVVFDIQSSLFKDTTIIDFEKRQITFRRYDKFSLIPVWEFHYAELNEYFKSIWLNSISTIKYESARKISEAERKKRRPPRLELAMPIHYPAWARRILGKEPPKLSIKGYQEITLAFKKKKTETAEETTREGGGFDFDHENMFTIRGSIGRLINIEIKTGTEATEGEGVGDQLKKLKIEYKADPDSANQLEDEVVQEVVAGYTNFQMSGQGLAGYSGSHEGLFGIKVRSQWGPLSLTTIVSRENAETQKKTLDPTGKTGKEFVKNEKDFIRNTYFFLDSIYLLKYIGLSDTAPEVTGLRVYKWESPTKTIDNTQNYAYALYGDQVEPQRFRLLREHDDYELDKKGGWIRFIGNAKPNDYNDLIAIFLRTKDSNFFKGDTTNIGTEGDVVFQNLWVLRNNGGASENLNDSTFFLMWRNVYPLAYDAKPDDFTIKVNRITQDKKEMLYTEETRKLFSHVLGITDEEGNAFVANEQIFDFNEKHMIIPPFKYNTMASCYSFENPELGYYSGEPNFKTNIYLDTGYIEPKFEIITTGTSKQNSFQLGWGIMPGTENVVTDGGIKLIKDRDYIIDYEFGSITLISERAKNANKIEVDFQQESLFMFDKRTFLGAYGKLDIPFIGRESYFATSIMGQFTSSQDKIPRIGYEPFNRFLFDANTRLDFEPEWMTAAVNFLPLISTTGNSSATLDLEVAYSQLVPDDRNDGEAYIDNFQSSERDYPLGEAHTLWHQASPPVMWLGDSLLFHPPAWNTYWYTPIDKDRTQRDEIWDLEAEENKNINQELYLSSLRLVCRPLPKNDSLLNGVSDSVGNVLVNPWTGIMTTLPSSLEDREDDRFLEFWVKNPNSRGVLYIDMGEVSENISLNGGPPDNIGNREKETIEWGEYESKYDNGLDGLKDTAEVYLFPNIYNNSWDTLYYGDSLLDKFIYDPARDNWKTYTKDHLGNRSKVSGTQNDKYLTTEDINHDGFSTREFFFRVKIDFNNLDSCIFLDTMKVPNKKDSEWRYFRVPINNDTYLDTTVGSPSWKNIKFVRLIWSDLPADTGLIDIEVTEMKFTGNQWEAPLIFDEGDPKIAATVINTIDDAGSASDPYYDRPPKKVKERDSDNNLKKDQALCLKYENVKAGDEVFVKRELSTYQKIDLSLYDEIRMYVRSWSQIIGTTEVPLSATDSIKFIFRFGNNDSSYYEYRCGYFKDAWWNSYEGLSISLKKLYQMKLDYHNRYGERLDSIDIMDTLSDGSRYRIYSKTGVLPTFTDIKWMAFGVAREQNANENDVASGELWVNGLRAHGIDKLKGWAFRGNLRTNWADFMDLSANVSYDDADFRQMSENFQMAKNSKVSSGLSAQWALNKFLPDKWGVAVPLGTGISASLSRPKQRPGSDIFLTHDDGEPDRLGDMTKDFTDLIINSDKPDYKTEAEHYEKSNINRSWYTSYSKTSDSKNPLVNLTADRITTNYSYTNDSTTELEGIIPENEKNLLSRKDIADDHINVRSTNSYSSALKYDLTPKVTAKKTTWYPFRNVKSENFPKQIKNYQIRLLPNRFNFDLADGIYKREYTYRSIEDKDTTASTERTVKTLNIAHGFQYTYSPISPFIETNFDFIVKRNFDKAFADWSGKTTDFFKENIFKLDPNWHNYYVTYGEQSRTQNASLRLDPQFFEWITHTADYRARYSHTPRIKDGDDNYLTTNVRSEFDFSSKFRIRSLFATISERTEKIKAISNPFGVMERSLDKINLNSFVFRYGASSDLYNDYLNNDSLAAEGILFYDFFKYQLGLKGRDFKDITTGNMDDELSFGGMRYRSERGYNEELYRSDKRSVSQDYSISTSLNLPKPVDIAITPISLKWKRDYNVIPDITHMDSSITFPDFNIGANSSILEKIPFVNQNMKKLGMRTSFSISKTEKKRYYNFEQNIIQRDKTIGIAWNPLISLNGLLKVRPINVDYTFNYSRDSTVSIENNSERINDGTNVKKYGNIWNVKYTIPGKPDREIKLLKRWSVAVKGDLEMGLNITHNSSLFTSDEIDEEGNKREEKDWSFLFNPNITYDFTENVYGVIDYKFDKSYEALYERERTNNIFSLTVRINFN